MDIPVSEAKAQLTELVRRAEAGEDIVLTRRGRPAVRLAPVRRKLTRDEKMALFEDIMRSGHGKRTESVDAARSQDFLYDEAGLPA